MNEQREPKFRAWDKNRKEMFDVATLSWLHGTVQLDSCYFMEAIPRKGHYPFDFNLMQYIGLKDKNGKEIYEGDILKAECSKTPGRIRWADMYGAMGWFFDNYHMDIELRDCDGDNYEVIGNIYENEDLLK